MVYTLDTFRTDIVAYLCDEPTAKVSVAMMMSFARPLFDNIANEHPTLFERLKYFVNATPATAMTINASTEFPRFGIINGRNDGEAGLCNFLELKQFLDANNLLFIVQRKDRFGAIHDCHRVDMIVSTQLQEGVRQDELIESKCTWVRNRSSNMVFVSPLTLMMAIMRGPSIGPFKRSAGTLCTMTLIIENEQASALKSLVARQRCIIEDLSQEQDSKVPSTQGWIKRKITMIILMVAIWLLCETFRRSRFDSRVCQLDGDHGYRLPMIASSQSTVDDIVSLN
ncbi:hypothetical protein PHYPSEUDO_013285 [Phytophthora pseudosyringae]|uniref:Uncharacterized protein n=1 Tax=Phytophthora pseudosyringae TaxID=221518 RepID=A0A8T1V834_9STRA|nr:hypothetical protein PHYPSEUDO_013285 [Phytophthora pseudosyringae]